MLKVIFLSLFTFVLLSTTAQVQTQIIGDSVFIHSNTGKGELILQNSTDTVNGFLFNKGAGRTAFRRGLIKINDSLYLIGADTLHLNNAGGTASGKNVYYVSRKFIGTAREVIAGNTFASISSTNGSYNSQLAKATPGSMVYSYPDPFSARNAALDAISGGTISSAEIVVMEGNSYTIGSNDSTKNGSINGQSPNNGTVADIQFSSTTLTADNSISSVMKNKIDMNFAEGSSLTYINSASAIYCYYQSDSTNASFRSGVYGLGSFYQVYGEVNGFNATFSLVSNRSAIVDFHAHEVDLQQWQGFYLSDYSVCNIDIDNLFSTDANVFIIGKSGTGLPQSGSIANAPRILNIKTRNCKFGKGQTPYPDSNDFWSLFGISNNTAIEGTTVTVDIGNLYMKCSDGGPLFYIGTHSSLYNLKLTVNISNLIQRDGHYYYAGNTGGLMLCYGPDIAVNNSITYNIKSGDIDAPLLGIMSFSASSTDAANKNNHFNINVGDLQKNNSAFVGGLFKVTSMLSQVAGEPLVIKVKGNFKSYDSSSLVYGFNEYYSFPFPCRYEFSGKYEAAVSNVPVAHFFANTGKIVAFTDALLINTGSAPSILADSVCTGAAGMCQDPAGTPISIPVYIKNVHATAAPSANVQQIGDTIKKMSNDFWTSNVSSSPLLTGLISYWKLDESSGNAVDAAGGGNNGTTTSVTYSATGKINTAYGFNGTTSYVDMGNTANLSLTTAGSLCAWVYTNDTTHTGVIISKGNPGSDINGYTFGFMYSGLYWELANATTAMSGSIPISGNIFKNKWYFVVLTWNGTYVNMYLNGTLVNGPTAQTVTPVSNVYPFRIGARGDYAGSTLWLGAIDEVAVYNRALTSTEVTNLYNSGAGKSYPF